MNQHDPLAHAQFDKDAPTSPPERLDYYMPATPPLGLVHALEYWWWTYRRRRHFRRSVRPLLEYDDALLADMGLRHGDLVWALRLPLKEDALSALSACRLQGMETADRLQIVKRKAAVPNTAEEKASAKHAASRSVMRCYR